MKLIKRLVLFVLLLSMIVGIVAGCGSVTDKVFTEADDFNNAKIGVLTGSSFDLLATEYYPDAEKLHYMSITDLIMNLKQKRIDGILMDKGYYAPISWDSKNLSCINMDMPATEYAVAFSKSKSSEPLKSQMNEFIRNRRENGWISELENKWFSSSEPDVNIDMSKLKGKNGTLRVASTVECKPFAYLKDGKFYGFDAEFIYGFAKEYGYGLEIDTMGFGALLPSINTGRYDFAISGITVTEERKESISFSDTYHKSPIVMGVFNENVDDKMTASDLETAKIGIITGTNWDNIVQTKYPKAQRVYFNSSADAMIALKQNKIDTYIVDMTAFASIRWEHDDITYIDDPIETISNALILAKEGYDKNLLDQINTFIAKSKENGTISSLTEKWQGSSEPTEHPDYTKLTGENGTLKIAVGDSFKPISYQRGLLYTGYEIDFLTLFAKEYGYKLEVNGMTFDALIPSVASGKCDIGACGVTITPERKESLTFTDPHFETHGIAIICDNSSTGNNIISLDDFKNAKLGVVTGSIYDGYSKAIFPDAKIGYYQTFADLFQCVQQGKIDGFMADGPNFNSVKRSSSDLLSVKVPDVNVEIGFGFQKNNGGAKLKAQMDDFIEELKADGTIDNLINKWYGDEEPTKTLEKPDFSDNETKISVGIDTTRKPFVYMLNNQYAGFETEVLYMFFEKYGYNPIISDVPFASGLAGLSGGKFDIVSAGLYMTEERKQSVNFSEPYMYADVVMVAYSKGGATSSFFDGVKESFEKTFIREDRWKLILEGMYVTMIISILSMVFGSILGFLLYLMSKSSKKHISNVAKIIGKIYSRIIAGTPIVVILMILFYLVFAEFKNLSGIVIAVVGFTLTFGAFVYDHMTVSVNSVDFGQTEAALALGYSKNKTFFRIIFPQAMTIFMPSYCGEVVSLIKATAVVGYIAVNDLTKMGDIIRSNTYEAFFPLIATAVIYFLLTWIVAALLNIAKHKFEPKRRSEKQILKGVER